MQRGREVRGVGVTHSTHPWKNEHSRNGVEKWDKIGWADRAHTVVPLA